tara:strand:- start:2251 stop:2859 length:609 start_codon:yes stop_codon:yes gene_type:complete
MGLVTRAVDLKGFFRMIDDKDSSQNWTILEEQNVFSARPWLEVSVQNVQLPNQRIVDDYYQVWIPDYVVMLVFTDSGQIIVERQYKHGVRHMTFTLPAGQIEVGEEPLVAAKRELLEETGFVADGWESYGNFVVNSNNGCGRAHLFVAREAQFVQEPNSGDLEEMEILLMNQEEVIDRVKAGGFATLPPVALIGLATNSFFM